MLHLKYFIFLFLPICCIAEAFFLPHAYLDQDILDQVSLDVAEELNKKFDHQNDSRTLRNTREYGYSFFKMLNGDFSYSIPPRFLQELGDRICRSLDHEAVEFTNIILSCYEEGFHLEPHVDVNVKDLYGNAPFYFDERVYGIIIEADANGHLYFVKWENGLVPPLNLTPIYSLNESPGLIFCLEGDLRKSPYFHAVSQVANRRLSITFRTVVRLPE